MSNSIEVLRKYNISEKDIDKLKTIGITSIQGLYMTSRKNILNIKGFTEKKISNIFTEANKIEPYSFFQNGKEFNKEREDTIYKISTGSKNLDNTTEGGLESNSINEIIGEDNTNISEFIHILSINALKKRNKIIFFDLNNNFNKEKIIQYAKGMNMNGKKCLENIELIKDIALFDELMDELDVITYDTQNKNCSLIIIDSLITIFQKLFKASLNNQNKLIKSELEIKYEIESKLGQILIKLKKICHLYNILIVITRYINNENLEEQNDLIKSDPNIEIILNYECKTRLKFKKIKNDKIKCIILNSPMISEKDCKFIITDKGILDC